MQGHFYTESVSVRKLPHRLDIADGGAYNPDAFPLPTGGLSFTPARKMMTLPMNGTRRIFNPLVFSVLSMLCLAAALPGRLAAQCTLQSPPLAFEPSPPGASRNGTNLTSGHQTDLQVYNSGGGPRMVMLESFGYSILDLSNPANPTAMVYDNMGLSSEVPTVGDGQSDVASIGVSPDGGRLVIGLNGNARRDLNSVAATAGANGLFNRITGGFIPRGALGTAVQHVGNRYLAYSLIPSSGLTVADITNIPGPLAPANVPSEHVGRAARGKTHQQPDRIGMEPIVARTQRGRLKNAFSKA